MMFRGVDSVGLLRQVLEELKPLPDRAAGTMRIVVACLLVWLVMLTFRNPMADIGVFMVFVFMQRSTLMTHFIALLVIAAMVLTSLSIVGIAMVSWNISWLRILLWGGVFWSCFYLMSRLDKLGAVFILPVSFGAVFCFGFDQTGARPNDIISQLGWLWCAVGLAMIFTMGCQYLFSAPTALDLLRMQVRKTLNLIQTHCIEKAKGNLSPMTLGVVGAARDQIRMLQKFGLLTTLQSENSRRIYTALEAIDRIALERREEGTNDQSEERQAPDSEVWLRVASHLRHLEPRLLHGKGVKKRSHEPEQRLSAEEISDPALAGAVRELLDAEACLDDPDRSTAIVRAPPGEPEKRNSVSAKDFSDTEFATRATVATMACYMFASMTDWSGIHTCMITCAVTALNNVDSQIFKQRLRIIGAAIGGLMGFLAMFLIPHADNLTGVMLIAAVGIAASAWVFMGREKYSYAGMQMGLAFIMLVMQDPHATTGFTVIRDRLVGILIGLLAMRYAFVWWTPKYIRSSEPAPVGRFNPI